MSLRPWRLRRRVALGHALLFVLGFSLVFMVLGASATALGRALNYYQQRLPAHGSVVIILFGLICQVVKRDLEPGTPAPGGPETRETVQALVSMAFEPWTPCIGPVSGAILHPRRDITDLAQCFSSPCTRLVWRYHSCSPRGAALDAFSGLVPTLPALFSG